MQKLRKAIIDKNQNLHRIFQDTIKVKSELAEILNIYNLKKKAEKLFLENKNINFHNIKIAIVGGYTFYPLINALEVFLLEYMIKPTFYVGEYNSYRTEIISQKKEIISFDPDIILIMPALQEMYDINKNKIQFVDNEDIINSYVENILHLCKIANKMTNAEIILSNFRGDGQCSIGSIRTKVMGSYQNIVRQVNYFMGIKSNDFIHICDSEFISNKIGTIKANDPKGWFESKQPGSSSFIFHLSKEIAFVISSIYQPMKKILILDLDNTCWGGVIGDDGIEGIELGDTSPRGEAFKSFQKFIKSLKNNGVILAVASKNERDVVMNAFRSHPEMVLKEEDIVFFAINWLPKSDSIKEMSDKLNLGLDSFVFIDDNPAEINIVNQFLPEVSTILLDGDPANFITKIINSRYFEPRKITQEDLNKTSYYKTEQKREIFKNSITDMESYLSSLKMIAIINIFNNLDRPRIVQLGNKSNQFNLTTIRRSEAEVQSIINLKDENSFVVRIEDDFGDYGLVGVVICEVLNSRYVINTWYMSCRVLERQVEYVILNEIVRRALKNKCNQVIGKYIKSNKNNLVKNLYPKLGFSFDKNYNDEDVYLLDIKSYKLLDHKIKLIMK